MLSSEDAEIRRPSAAARPIITVQQHILQEQRRFPGASGEFSWLLSGITLATKMIQAQVRRAGLTDILGAQGDVNVQGEVQQKLDVYANEALLHCLSLRESIGILASEENETPVTIRHESPRANYAVVFDPLDGSSNIDVNVSVGTTFSVLKRPEGDASKDVSTWVLQPGARQVAAGYVVYGSSTVLVYSVGNGVHGFTLDPAIGAYVLSHENIRMPAQGGYYSVNEAYRDDFPAVYQQYLERLRTGGLGRRYASRYIGSMVADFHRTLPEGGRVPVSAHRCTACGEAAPVVRGESDRVSGGAGGGLRDRRAAADPGDPAGEPASADAARGGRGCRNAGF